MKHKIFLVTVLLISFCKNFAQANDTAIARLNNYRNKVLIIFYKCNSLDNELAKAISVKNINDIETNRIALLQCADDGIKTLYSMEDFDGDASLKFNCKEALNFYKQTAEYDVSQLSDFFINDEKFNKLKTGVTGRHKLTEAEIKAYNTEVKNNNAAVTHFKQLSNFIDGNRKLTLKNWNESEKIFTDNHLSYIKEKSVKQ